MSCTILYDDFTIHDLNFTPETRDALTELGGTLFDLVCGTRDLADEVVLTLSRSQGKFTVPNGSEDLKLSYRVVWAQNPVNPPDANRGTRFLHLVKHHIRTTLDKL